MLPDVHGSTDLGEIRLLPREALAHVYAAADVFVMPSRHETFGLVMLEAMATGTPVAAYPVEGPLEVVGQPPMGGVLHADLSVAWYRALALPRHEARERAHHRPPLRLRHLVAADGEAAHAHRARQLFPIVALAVPLGALAAHGEGPASDAHLVGFNFF